MSWNIFKTIQTKGAAMAKALNTKPKPVKVWAGRCLSAGCQLGCHPWCLEVPGDLRVGGHHLMDSRARLYPAPTPGSGLMKAWPLLAGQDQVNRTGSGRAGLGLPPCLLSVALKELCLFRNKGAKKQKKGREGGGDTKEVKLSVPKGV